MIAEDVRYNVGTDNGMIVSTSAVTWLRVPWNFSQIMAQAANQNLGGRRAQLRFPGCGLLKSLQHRVGNKIRVLGNGNLAQNSR